MKKALKRTGTILISVILVVIIAAVILFWKEIRSLASIRQVDDYGLFQMTYYSDYGFDEFLKVGAENDSDIERFLMKHLLKGLPINLNITGGGCTVFVTKNENGDILFGRNWDFSYSPGMQVITRPKNGYASVSTANLAFVGYSEDKLPSGLNLNSFLALAAPYVAIDGMNEKGVAMALVAVPESEPPFDENKVTLNTTTAIRLVLDKAATVDEAVELLKHYNIYFSQGIDCKFVIGDASGKSVMVEYYDGGIQIVTTDEDYQIASNFIAYNGVNIGEGFNEFERYDKVKETIDSNDCVLSVEQSVALLAEVGITYNGEDKLEWTVIYNLSNLNGTIFANRNTGNLIDFSLIP